MEISDSQIAGLILGYLKSEKCFSAFDAFLENSSYFHENIDGIKRGDYFVTRVAGLCLKDFLKQYEKIYTIVQARLEASDYYSEINAPNLGHCCTLADQILYLLDGKHCCNYSLSDHNASQETSEAEKSNRNTGKKKLNNSLNRSIGNISFSSDILNTSEVQTQTMLEYHNKFTDTIDFPNTPTRLGDGQSAKDNVETTRERNESSNMYREMIEEIIGNEPMNLSNDRIDPNCESFPKSKQNKNGNNTEMDDYNNEAVCSIIAASQNMATLPNNSNKQEISNTDVYVFDGSLDTLLKTSSTTNTNNNMIPATNQVLISNGNLIVFPPDNTNPTLAYENVGKPFYMVNNNINNQAILNVSENDIMAMPTIIVNGKAATGNNFREICPKPPPMKQKKTKQLTVAKPDLIITAPPKTTVITTATPEKTVITTDTLRQTTIVTSENLKNIETPKTASHVRNLDFSTPLKSDLISSTLQIPQKVSDKVKTRKMKLKNVESNKTAKIAEKPKQWDSDLRLAVGNGNDTTKNNYKKKRAPRKTTNAKRRTKRTKKNANETSMEQDGKKIEEALQSPEKEKKSDSVKGNCEKIETSKENASANNENDENIVKASFIEAEVAINEVIEENVSKSLVSPNTPPKAIMPKTPCIKDTLNATQTGFTPFNAVLEEQLRGVDLTTVQTPNLPITPGLSAFTPSALNTYRNIPTDYSTSSSYYQPSDNEQNKSIEQLIEEYNRVEGEQDEEGKPSTNSNCKGHLKNFHANLIGRKNLNLVKRPLSTSSSSSSSSSDLSSSDTDDEATVIYKEDVKCNYSLRNKTDKAKQVELRKELEEKRKTTVAELKKAKTPNIKIKSIKNVSSMNSLKRNVNRNTKINNTRKTVTKGKRITFKESKKEDKLEQGMTAEAKDLVTGLKERGIHLMPNKKVRKLESDDDNENNDKIDENDEKKNDKVAVTENKAVVEEIIEEELVEFDRRFYSEKDHIQVVYDETNTCNKTIDDYDSKLLEKVIEAKLTNENGIINRKIGCGPFEMCLNIESNINVLIPRKVRPIIDGKCKGIEERHCEDDGTNDDLMNYAIVGSAREENSPDVKLETKTTRKRKSRLSIDSKTESGVKKMKCSIPNELLKKMNVDAFLDHVHKK